MRASATWVDSRTSSSDFTIERGVMSCSMLYATWMARRRSISSQRALHRAGDPVGVEDAAPVDVARRAADRLDQRAVGAEEALLVGVEDRHQRHLGQVEPLAQQVDADQHVEVAEPEAAQDLHPLDGVDVGVQVAHPHAGLLQVVGEVLGHPLGERGDQHALPRRDPLADLVQQVVHLALAPGGPRPRGRPARWAG